MLLAGILEDLKASRRCHCFCSEIVTDNFAIFREIVGFLTMRVCSKTHLNVASRSLNPLQLLFWYITMHILVVSHLTILLNDVCFGWALQ